MKLHAAHRLTKIFLNPLIMGPILYRKIFCKKTASLTFIHINLVFLTYNVYSKIATAKLLISIVFCSSFLSKAKKGVKPQKIL